MKKAFTLAEILISLTIIGIIAALTIPTIISNITERANITKLQATQKELQDAVKFMMMNERVTDVNDSSLFSETTNSDTFTTDYIKTISNQSSEFLATSEYNTLSGSKLSSWSCSNNGVSLKFSFMLPSGAAVEFCNAPLTGSSAAGYFTIDVNSIDPPNKVGRDFFVIEIMNDGTLGIDLSNNKLSVTEAGCRKGDYHGLECFGLLKENNWKVTY